MVAMSQETDGTKRSADDQQEHSIKRTKVETTVSDSEKNKYEARISELENEVKALKQVIEQLKSERASTEEASAGTSSATSVRKVVLGKSNASEKDSKPKPKATFGASSFTIKPVVTPLSSFTSSSNTNISPAETPTAPNTAGSSPKPTFGVVSSPKPLFGATTSFEKSIQNKSGGKNVFDSIPWSSEKNAAKESTGATETAASTSSFGSVATSSFGANSRFGNAFQESLKKKSFLDQADDEKKTKEELTPTSSTPQQFKQVELEKVQNIQTGEENEESVFSTTAKLFELDLTKVSDGWKERGLGPVHVNQSKLDKKNSRIVMRSHGLLRVILNFKITPESKLFTGFDASLTPGKFLRINSLSAEGSPIQYLLKFGSEATRDQIYETVEGIKKEIAESKNS